MHIDGCICECTAAIGIHRVGANIACGAGYTVEDDGIRVGEIPRAIECNHSHGSKRNVILSPPRTAGGGGSGGGKTVVACQRGDTASTLGVNSRDAMLPTCGDKDQGCGNSQGQGRAKDSFHGALLIRNFR